MSEDKKPFTVKDRRHFTSEGAARETAPEVDPDPRPEPSASPREPPASVPPAADTDAGEPPSAGIHVEEPPRAESAGGRFPSDFASLLVTLGTQGSMLLAGVVPGSSEAGPPDLDGTRDVISLLESLKTRTEGRLPADEDRLLSGILYELRMGYVALRKGPRA